MCVLSQNRLFEKRHSIDLENSLSLFVTPEMTEMSVAFLFCFVIVIWCCIHSDMKLHAGILITGEIAERNFMLKSSRCKIPKKTSPESDRISDAHYFSLRSKYESCCAR